MKAFAAAALMMALVASGEAAAWQMETVEPGQGQNIIGGDRSGSGTGGGVDDRGAGPLIRIEPVQPDGRGTMFEGDRRRPALFDEGRGPFYRPGSGRNCSGEGPGRVCF